jgi:hypothetical protein
MKKFFFMSIMVLMAALTLTSCGSDDDKKDEPQQPKDKTIKYVVTAQFDQILLDICDITANYKDASGKNAQEKVTSTTWSKTIKPNGLPVQMGVNFVYKVKEDKMTQSSYTFKATLTQDAKIGSATRNLSEKILDINNSSKEKTIEILNKRSKYAYGMYLSADGSITEKEPSF